MGVHWLPVTLQKPSAIKKHQVLYRTRELGLRKCIVWLRTPIKSLVALGEKPRPTV